MHGDYERELKGILHADPEVIRRVTNACSPIVKSAYSRVKRKPFLVTRVAGSFGMDLVAIRADISFPIEVKAGTQKTIRFGGTRLEAQAEELINICSTVGVVPIYAFRLKNVRCDDAWRIFTVEMTCELRGTARTLHRRLPKLRKTADGNLVMEWDNGMPLHKFIEYLC
jgi:Holliday junction resolvase